MFKKIKSKYLSMGAAMTLGLMASSTVSHAAPAATNNWGDVAGNLTTSISELPGLVTALSYMFGIVLSALGVMKIKDHVENPSQTPLKDGAIRLCAGGALFGLPIVTEAMQTTLGTGASATAATLNQVSFSSAPVTGAP